MVDTDPGNKEVVIYQSVICPFAQRAKICLLEKGVDHQVVPIDLATARPDWFLKLNPRGKVPVLKHNGHIIYESAVIVEYLEEVLPKHKIFPSDPYLRAIARIWVDMCNSQYVKAYYTLLVNRDSSKRDALVKNLHGVLQTAEDAIAKYQNAEDGPFFFGKLSVVDVTTWYPFLKRQSIVLKKYRNLGIDAQFKRVNKWFAAMDANKNFQKSNCDEALLIKAYRKYAEEKDIKDLKS